MFRPMSPTATAHEDRHLGLGHVEQPGFAHRIGAEVLGTFVLVLGGVGSAVYAARFPDVGIGLLGVAFGFGLSLLAAVWALGMVSGGHFNPAVTMGLCAARRFPWRDMPAYIAAQILGGFLASLLILYIAQGQPGGYIASEGGLAANGYGAHSPGQFGMGAALVAEVILTFIFLTVILGATSKKAVAGFAGIPIGLTLTLVHLVGIPITNLSVNPARSTGPAVFVGGWALEQLWLFWVAPIVGGLAAGLVGKWLHEDEVLTDDAPKKLVSAKK
jgi:aquaporin Z